MKGRLLYVVNLARWFTTHRLDLAKAARSAGYEVIVATPSSKYVEQIENAGLTWLPLEYSRGSLNPFHELRLFFQLASLYRRVRPDLIHHVTAKPVLYGTVAARLTTNSSIINAFTGLGHVFLGNEFRYRLARALLGLFYKLFLRASRSKAIFQNPEDMAFFVGQGWLAASQCVVIPSGVDVEKFSPTERSENGAVRIILPARMLRTKGVVEFVSAARVLKARGVDARFILVGAPDPENPASIPLPEIERWAEEGVIEYWGETDDMPRIYQAADIVCLPSYREGMPKVLIEAGACGIAVVTTDTPGCRDVVIHGVNGLLVPVGEIASLADALDSLINDARLRQRLGDGGRDRAVREFSGQRMSNSTLALYEQLSR